MERFEIKCTHRVLLTLTPLRLQPVARWEGPRVGFWDYAARRNHSSIVPETKSRVCRGRRSRAARPWVIGSRRWWIPPQCLPSATLSMAQPPSETRRHIRFACGTELLRTATARQRPTEGHADWHP